MTKVYISPTAKQVKDDNGVGRVVLEQHKRLPQHGIELAASPGEADVIASHINGDGLPPVDVLHLHGLYWNGDRDSGSYQRWHLDANRGIVQAARAARVITVPSEWVAMPFKRDMRLSPMVIPHGIDVEEWEPLAPQGYALWNKNRASDVCSPIPAYELARRGIQVVSTFRPDGPKLDNLHTIGVQPFEKMKEWIQHATYYLATTKETFGLGTLEAMAAGVPILGFRHGGTADLVTHLEDGYLVEPGDYDGLAEGARYILSNFPRMREAARATASLYTWGSVMSAYARIYNAVFHVKQSEEHRVAVVITNYNYGQWLGEAIQSALGQTHPPAEIIIVDDGSTDNVSHETIREALDLEAVQAIYQTNQGVAAARNRGIQAATSEYIICLDADDRLLPNAIATLLPAMIEDRALGITYGNLNLLHPDGSTTDGRWRQPFDWAKQAKPTNPPATCIPCAAMFRKSMWERAGGYKQVYAPGEDAEFWTRGLSVGFAAKQVTTAPLFDYRLHESSASRTKQYKPIDVYHPWMRDKQYPLAAPSSGYPLVRSYSEPLVSVIIPVGPNHPGYLPAALDSLLGQTFREWEAVVVNDSGQPLDSVLKPYPFVTYRNTVGGRQGAGKARNIGIEAATAPLLLFLDADDYLDPHALGEMLGVYVQSGGRYVYSDWVLFNGDDVHAESSPSYNAHKWLQSVQHAVTSLVPAEWVRDVGGFDEHLVAWEDWDFFLKLAINGYWGIHVAKPLLYYRYQTGTRREAAKSQADSLKEIIYNRYAAYINGVEPMAGCCGGNGNTIMQAKKAIEGIFTMSREADSLASGATRLKFTGKNSGAISYRSKYPDGGTYKGGQMGHQYVDVPQEFAEQDVPFLVSLGVWEVIREGAPIQEPAQVLTHHTGGQVLPEIVGTTLQAPVNMPPPLPEDELMPIPDTESGYVETPVPWFAQPLSGVEGLLPAALANLAEAGVTTLGEAAQRTDEELDAISGVGPATIALIRSATP